MKYITKELILIAVSCFLLCYACQPSNKKDEILEIEKDNHIINNAIQEAPTGLWIPIVEDSLLQYEITTSQDKAERPIVPLLVWTGEDKIIILKYNGGSKPYMITESINDSTSNINLQHDSIHNHIFHFRDRDTIKYKHIVKQNLVARSDFINWQAIAGLTTWREFRDRTAYFYLSFIDSMKIDTTRKGLFRNRLYIEGDSNRYLDTRYPVGNQSLRNTYPNEYRIAGNFSISGISYIYLYDNEYQLVKLYVIEKIEPNQITLIDVYKDEKVIWKKQEGVDIKEAQEKWLKSPWK